jgi:antitoxin ParD1/3/4
LYNTTEDHILSQPIFCLDNGEYFNANTKTTHISLPESLIESAKIQAEEGQYGNVSDYVRSLIRKDVRQREEDKLERMLLEGVRSGRGIEIGSKEWENFWEDIYASIRAKTHS